MELQEDQNVQEPVEQQAGDPVDNESVDAQAQLQAELEAAQRKRDEYLDIAQRVQAEFDNYRRRTNAVRSESYDDGVRETITLMLPVLDNLERAVDAAKEAGPLREGIELVHRQFTDMLSKRGVEVINRLGEVFDPMLENAVMQGDASEGEPGTVCEVFLKGYKLHSRVLRHAMVKVVAG